MDIDYEKNDVFSLGISFFKMLTLNDYVPLNEKKTQQEINEILKLKLQQ